MFNTLDKTRAELSAPNRPTGGAARPVFIASVVVTLVLAAMLLGCPLSWDWRVGISPGRLALLVAMATSALAAGWTGGRLRRRRLQDLADLKATARGLEDQRRQTVMLRRALVACSSGDMAKGLRRLLSQVCRGVGIQAGGVVVVGEAGSIGTLVSTYRLPTVVSEQPGDHLAAITEWIERAATMAGPAVTSTAKWTALTEFGLSGRVLAVPLTADGRLQGVMVLAVHERFEGLHPAHQLFVNEIAESMATAIGFAHQTRSLRSANRTLEESVRDRTFELEVLLELSQVIGHALDYPQLLRLLVEHSHWVVSCDVAACLSLAPEGAPEETPDDIHIRPLRPLSAATSRGIVNALESAAADYAPSRPKAGRRGVHTLVAEPPDPSAPAVDSLTSSVVVPIHAGEHGKLSGLLLVGSEAPNAFPAERVRLLTKVASRAGRAVGQLRALLNDEQKRLEQVVASLPEGVILLDGELRARLVASQARSCLQSLGDVTVGEVVERLGAAPLADLLDESEQSDMVEIVGLHDPERIFGLRTSPVTAGPEAGGYVLTLQELTEQRRDQARIAQQGRMAAVGQLAAGIAHDFNNLLTSVIGRAELLLLDAELDGDMLEDITVIRDQGRRAAEMIQQILDFSRRSNPGLRSVDLARAVRKATDLLVRTIPEHIRIQLDLGSGLLPVMANTTQLQQVLTNLAVNARDAMPDGGLLRVSLSRQRFVGVGAIGRYWRAASTGALTT